VYYLAIVSAIKTQKIEHIVLWAFEEPKGKYWKLLRDKVDLEILVKPEFPALRAKEEYLVAANLKNYYEWKVLYEHGGMYLDLDTFGIQDITYAYDDIVELVVSDEVEETCWDYPFFNNHFVIAQRHSPIMRRIMEETERILTNATDLQWGETAVLLHKACKRRIDRVKALPFGAVGGTGKSKISARLYQEGSELWDDAKVLHLYGASFQQYLQFTEESIANSRILFARTVRETLGVEDWSPYLSRGRIYVHFVLTSKELTYPYYSAIKSAAKTQLVYEVFYGLMIGPPVIIIQSWRQKEMCGCALLSGTIFLRFKVSQMLFAMLMRKIFINGGFSIAMVEYIWT